MLRAALIGAAFWAGLATGAAGHEIVGATLMERTDRYGHNVLGGSEYAMMAVIYRHGDSDQVTTAFVALPQDRVFEDVAARLADLTGDGLPEIVVVEASRTGGGELVVYGLGAGGVEKIAATPPIGQGFRWLAPAGIGDLDGDGHVEVAYVDRPHLDGILRIWRFRDAELVEIASKSGFSNHRIGEDFITSGLRDCGQGPELVLPNFNWTGVMVARLSVGEIVAEQAAAAAGPAEIDAALACAD